MINKKTMNYVYALGVFINTMLVFVNLTELHNNQWALINTGSGILCGAGYFNTLGENNGDE
jgi:hypothetical protein